MSEAPLGASLIIAKTVMIKGLPPKEGRPFIKRSYQFTYPFIEIRNSSLFFVPLMCCNMKCMDSSVFISAR